MPSISGAFAFGSVEVLMAGESTFSYVRIPADDSLSFEELSAVPSEYGDTLAELLKKTFGGGALTNMEELRSQYGSKIDEKMGDFQAAANRGSVEVLPLVRNSKTTIPIPNCQTALYYDEMGTLKDRPSNSRAFALAKECGLDLENPLRGDVFVGRVNCDSLTSVNFGKNEMDSSSPWIKQAPAQNAEWKGCLSDFSDIANKKAVGAKTADEEEAENISRGWRWTQTESDLEVLVTLPEGTAKGAITVKIGRTSLSVALKADPAKAIVEIKKLRYPVSADESTWVMGSDARGPHVQVTLEKEQEQTWPAIEAKG